MKEKLLEMIESQHKASDGKCGTYLKEVADYLKISISEVGKLVDGLPELKKRIGIHGTLKMKIDI